MAGIDDVMLLKKSVTANDVTTVRDGAVLRVVVPFLQGTDRFSLPPKAPPYWSMQRDIVLRSTPHHEAMWAAALGIAITKTVSLAWEVSGKVQLRIKQMQDILLDADGRQFGWVSFLSKQLRDYLTCDNGCFFEIIRANKGSGSKIVGIRHLDSVRVTRTGDPETPILFRDKWGKFHELRDYQVCMFSEMPDPGETYYGVGFSAAARAYQAIYKLAAIETYLKEKVAGLRPLAIYVVNGVLDTQLKNAVNAAKQEEVSRGLVGYMGAVIVGIPDAVQPQVATIPLSELPDRFQRKEEFDISVLTYADVLGLDPQDLQPLSGQSLGSGAQSQVLHDKARGKGLIAWRQDFTHAMNNFVMPEYTSFAFTEKDYRDLMQRSSISTTRATAAASRIGSKITTAAQELQLMVDQDELPKEFLPKDITPETNLSDTEIPGDPSIEGVDRLDEDGNVKPGVKTDAQIQAEQQASMIARGQASGMGNAAKITEESGKIKPQSENPENEEDKNEDEDGNESKKEISQIIRGTESAAVEYANYLIKQRIGGKNDRNR